MFTLTTLSIACLLLLVAVAAGWPLLVLPRLRAAALCAGGTCCVGSGSALLGLLAAGLIALPGAGQAAAQEEVPIEQGPATDSAPPIDAAIAEELAVAIDVAQPAATVAPAAEAPSDPNADDLKIETQPDGTIVIPAGRPQWVESAPKLLKNVYTIPVTSGPFARDRDAREQLDRELMEATDEFIADHLGSRLAPKFLRYDARAIKERFIHREIYEETITVSIGPMHQSHALLEFGPEFRAEIDGRWAKVRATSRLGQMGLFAGGALLLLGSVFGYFRLDNATRGFYTGRLQFLAAAAILAVVGAGAVLSQWMTWM